MDVVFESGPVVDVVLSVLVVVAVVVVVDVVVVAAEVVFLALVVVVVADIECWVDVCVDRYHLDALVGAVVLEVDDRRIKEAVMVMRKWKEEEDASWSEEEDVL